MSIIKHVTLQKIVAHDFRYDPRMFGKLTKVQLFSIVIGPRMHTVLNKLCSACLSVCRSRRMVFNLLDSAVYYPKPLALVTASTTPTAPTNPLRPCASIIFQYSFSTPTPPLRVTTDLLSGGASYHFTLQLMFRKVS